MKNKSSPKYSLGDIISKLVNRRLNPLTQRRKLFSSGKPSSSSIQSFDPMDFQLSKRKNAIEYKKSKSQMQGNSIDLVDLQNWNSRKHNYSRLFQNSKVYSNVISNRINSKDEDPQKKLVKQKLLSTYITRKQNSGELQKYLGQQKIKITHMFRETFRTLKDKQKKQDQLQTPSLFYLTVRSKDRLSLKVSSITKSQRKNGFRHGKSLYQTFYK